MHAIPHKRALRSYVFSPACADIHLTPAHPDRTALGCFLTSLNTYGTTQILNSFQHFRFLSRFHVTPRVSRYSTYEKSTKLYASIATAAKNNTTTSSNTQP